MKLKNRILACVLTVMLVMPSFGVMAEEAPSVSENAIQETDTLADLEKSAKSSADVIEPEAEESEENVIQSLSANTIPNPPEIDVVQYNTGNCEIGVMSQEMSDYLEQLYENGETDVAENYLRRFSDVKQWDTFNPDGSYTINIPEPNPFFPYEVKFISVWTSEFNSERTTTREWFMSPEDSVEVNGHTFQVSATIDNTALTQMTLEVAGDTVVVYPKEKSFTNDGDNAQTLSLIPLKTQKLDTVDLRNYSPVELTMVKVKPVYGKKDVSSLKIAWKEYDDYNDDYTVSGIYDALDLSGGINNYSYTTSWEMILGDADQLNPDNVRYILPVWASSADEWATLLVHAQDSQGNRSEVQHDEPYWSSSELYTDISYREVEDKDIYVSLQMNHSIFTGTHLSSVKVVKGIYDTPSEAVKALASNDVTAQLLCKDMAPSSAGYKVTDRYEMEFTMLAYNAAGDLIGCAPFSLSLYTENDYISLRLYKKTEEENILLDGSYRFYKEDREVVFSLVDVYELNGLYSLVMDYDKNSGDEYPDITAVYPGKFATIAEANAAGAKDIKNTILGSIYDVEGYSADYSKGVYFTAFAGEDNNPKRMVYSFCVKTERAGVSQPVAESGTNLYFYGLRDTTGNDIPAYMIRSVDDSYAERNFITILVEQDVNLNNMYAPLFRASEKAVVRTSGSVAPEVSGESYHSFANGPLQYTVYAENGENSKSYWVQIKKASSANGQLYILSLADQTANTYVENGITYSTREIMLDSYHDYLHDICIVNVGAGSISGLSAELSSDVLEVDPYWTLKGDQALEGLGTVETPDYKETGMEGELPNLAKIRLRAKSGVANGSDISGTLTIKSGDKVLMVLTLTGVVGDPCITTTEIPAAVKYVPYGTPIQNSNKYSWINVSYEQVGGTLPEGMEIKSNGELYGVPQEAGTFTFKVKASFSSSREDYTFPSRAAELTLTVNENTNDYVYGATDAGYEIREHIGKEEGTGTHDYILSKKGDQLFVSAGEFPTFVDLWLNGQKLVEGEDYTKESGSTRITIRSQTFANKVNQEGTNTLAAEFREGSGEIKDLKRTAQNFRIDYTKRGGSSGGSGKGSGSGSSDGGSGSATAAGSAASTLATFVLRLVDTANNPLANTTVELHSTPKVAKTNANGIAVFSGVESGAHTLYVKDSNGNILASKSLEILFGNAVLLNGNQLTVKAGSAFTLNAQMNGNELMFVSINDGDLYQILPAPTGDTNNIALWVVVLLLSCGMGYGLYTYNKKKKQFQQ